MNTVCLNYITIAREKSSAKQIVHPLTLLFITTVCLMTYRLVEKHSRFFVAASIIYMSVYFYKKIFIKTTNLPFLNLMKADFAIWVSKQDLNDNNSKSFYQTIKKVIRNTFFKKLIIENCGSIKREDLKNVLESSFLPQLSSLVYYVKTCKKNNFPLEGKDNLPHLYRLILAKMCRPCDLSSYKRIINKLHNGLSLLHIATITGSFELCEELIKMGADQNVKTLGNETSLMLAFSYEHYKLVNLFFTLQNKLDPIADHGLSVATLIKGLCLDKDYSISDHKQTPHYKIEKELFQRAFLANLFSLNGYTRLTNSNQTYELEGFTTIYPLHIMNKSFTTFKKKYPKYRNISNKISTILESFLQKKNEILQNSMVPLFLHNGYEKHLVTIILYQNHFFICNLGASRRVKNKFFEAYSYNGSQEIIKDLQKENTSGKKYLKKIDELAKKYNFTSTTLTRFLEKLLYLPPQTSGNCTVANNEAGIYLLFILLTIPFFDLEKNLKLHIKSIKKQFEKWQSFYKTFYFEKYILKKIQGKNKEEVDLLLIKRIINIVNLPRFQGYYQQLKKNRQK
ncbi:ankyrin-like protein [Candidatus Rubidus massiliensis]|nr:ankyrin-like protein [Candidatus Rubidus massiliensis]